MSAQSANPGAPRFSAMHVRLVLVALGLLCLALSVVASWLRPDQAEVFSLWAMIGLGLAAIPVLIDSLTSLKADGFANTRPCHSQIHASASSVSHHVTSVLDVLSLITLSQHSRR